MTTRRGFLRLFSAAVVAPKSYFFAPVVGGWTSDVIVKPTEFVFLPAQLERLDPKMADPMGYYADSVVWGIAVATQTPLRYLVAEKHAARIERLFK